MSISLKPHNVETYQKVIEKFKRIKKSCCSTPNWNRKDVYRFKIVRRK